MVIILIRPYSLKLIFKYHRYYHRYDDYPTNQIDDLHLKNELFAVDSDTSEDVHYDRIVQRVKIQQKSSTNRRPVVRGGRSIEL